MLHLAPAPTPTISHHPCITNAQGRDYEVQGHLEGWLKGSVKHKLLVQAPELLMQEVWGGV